MVGRWELRLTLTRAGLGLALVLGAFSLAMTAAVTLVLRPRSSGGPRANAAV